MIEYLSVEEVIAMHDAFLREFGGLPGIRDINLLISALETAKSRMFGQDLHLTIYDKAAAYLYHIVRNHPFNLFASLYNASSAIAMLSHCAPQQAAGN